MKCWYLATPYSSADNGLMQRRFRAACRIAARLLTDEKIVVYCPIAHTHPIADEIGNHADGDFWLEFDRPMMERCDGLLIAELPGWGVSKGINRERQAFHDAGKPTKHIGVRKWFTDQEWQMLVDIS